MNTGDIAHQAAIISESAYESGHMKGTGKIGELLAALARNLAAVEARVMEHIGAHDVQGQIEAPASTPRTFDPMRDIPTTDAEADVALRDRRDALHGSILAGMFRTRRAQGEAVIDAYCDALEADLAAQPHTPATVGERVLAAGLGEAQPEAQAVTPAELGGVYEISAVYIAGLGWRGVAAGAGVAFETDAFSPAPEPAFALVAEAVRQDAHARNAQREAAESVATDARRDAADEAATDRDQDATGYYTEPDGYHYGP